MSIKTPPQLVKTYILRFLGKTTAFEEECQALQEARPTWKVEKHGTSTSLAMLHVPDHVRLTTPGVFGGLCNSLAWEVHEHQASIDSPLVQRTRGQCPLRLQHYLRHHRIPYQNVNIFRLEWTLPTYQIWDHDALVAASILMND